MKTLNETENTLPIAEFTTDKVKLVIGLISGSTLNENGQPKECACGLSVKGFGIHHRDIPALIVAALAQRDELLSFLKSIVPLLYARCDKSADDSARYQDVCTLIARAESGTE